MEMLRIRRGKTMRLRLFLVKVDSESQLRRVR